MGHFSIFCGQIFLFHHSLFKKAMTAITAKNPPIIREVLKIVIPLGVINPPITTNKKNRVANKNFLDIIFGYLIFYTMCSIKVFY